MRPQHRDVALAVVGHDPRQAFEEDAAERVHVRALVDRPTLDLLRSDVVHGTDELARVREAGSRLGMFGQAEVGEIDALEHLDPVVDARSIQDVSWLDVTMDQTGLVGSVQRSAHLTDERTCTRLRAAAPPAQERLQVGAVDVAHHDVT